MATGGLEVGVDHTSRTPPSSGKLEPIEPSTGVNRIIKQAWPLGTELYVQQRSKHWPRVGKHIVAHYDDNSIVVYQAFCHDIADSAVKNQKFGGGGFSFDRMSWIKTNFLWMMYRCGWATKHRQERVLAVRITLDGFNHILAAAYTATLEKSEGLQKNDIEVRLQWDPDHDTDGHKEQRRAIQLGLKTQMLQKYSNEMVISITDVTEFVRHQHRILKQQGQWSVSMPVERVYTPSSAAICRRIELDHSEASKAQLVT